MEHVGARHLPAALPALVPREARPALDTCQDVKPLQHGQSAGNRLSADMAELLKRRVADDDRSGDRVAAGPQEAVEDGELPMGDAAGAEKPTATLGDGYALGEGSGGGAWA